MFYYGKNMLFEGKREEQAREKAKKIIFDDLAEGTTLSPERLNRINQCTISILNSYEKILFSNSKIRGSQVMRLFPIFCKHAVDNEIYAYSPEEIVESSWNELFERMKKIINYLYTLTLRGENLSKISLDTSFDDLESFYGKMMENEEKEENERIANTEYNENTDYTVVGPLDYETAKKYGDLSAWQHRGNYIDGEICYTQKPETWNKYTFGDKYTVYVILKNGWENIPPNNAHLEPFNEYGLSMIFVIIDEKQNLVWCNTRLNHFADYKRYGKHVDHALTKEEISKLIGRKFDEVFIPKKNGENEQKKWLDFSAECDRRIARGEPLDEIFEDYDNFMLRYKKYCKVENEDYACNFYFLNKGILVKNQWFDEVEYFWEGFAKVQLNGYANVIDMNGEYRSEQWFDDLTVEEGVSEYGLILVYNEGKHNVLNAKTKKLISNQWFDDYDFIDEDDEESERGLIMKFLTSKREIFYMDTNGKLHDNISENKKMKTIIISESQAKMLKENMHMINEKMSEEAFISHVKNYLKQLLTNPIGAQPDAFLKSNGLDGKTLLPKLLDYDIIVKKTKIVSEGKDRFEIVYKIPRNNFEKKILRLYNELFDDDTKEINESVNQELLAPNGKPSNLPPNLWKLVRTPQFKAWFGDWENNPKGSSKVVDNNGEPRVVYHGTKNKFTEFSYDYFGNTDSGDSGKGFYFMPYDSGYGGANNIVMAMFLNIRKPYVYNKYSQDTKLIHGISKVELFNRSVEELLSVYKNMLNEYQGSEEYAEFLKVYKEIEKSLYSIPKEELVELNSCDGVFAWGEHDIVEYVAKFPNQIKSIENTVFSSESNNINEDGAAGVGVAGATNCNGSSGAFVQPAFPMMKRTIKTKTNPQTKDINEEAVIDTAIGDFGYDAPPFKKKKKDPAYDHRNMMKKSFRRK